MSRWTETVTLLVADPWIDDEGNQRERWRKTHEIMCNERRLTIASLAHMRSSDIRTNNASEYVDVGLRPECEIEVYSIDYEGEDRCVYRDQEYEIQYAYGGGRTLVLGLMRKLGNRSEPHG